MRHHAIALSFIVLVAAGAGGRGWAQDLTKDVINLDFTNAASVDALQVNGSAAFTEEGGKQRLRLTDALSEGSSAFVKTPAQISDYLATFDFEVRRVEDDDNPPADGFLFLAQTVGPEAIGGGGGGIGLIRNDRNAVPSTDEGGGFPGYSYGVEFNTWADQGLPDNPQTVALDLLGIRTKLNMTPFPHVDGGVFRAQVRVTPAELTVTVSGGKQNMAPTVILTSPNWLVGDFFKAPKPLYFGFTAGTGGAQQITDIFNLRIQTAAAF